jgi:hypothetical protein
LQSSLELVYRPGSSWQCLRSPALATSTPSPARCPQGLRLPSYFFLIVATISFFGFKVLIHSTCRAVGSGFTLPGFAFGAALKLWEVIADWTFAVNVMGSMHIVASAMHSSCAFAAAYATERSRAHCWMCYAVTLMPSCTFPPTETHPLSRPCSRSCP